MWRLLSSMLVAVLAMGCGDDAECLLDTDCPIPMRCEAEQCVPRGEDAGARDAGGGPLDAGPDAGSDAGSDGGPAEERVGTLTAIQAAVADSPPHSVRASFRVGPSSSDCTSETVGGCTVSDCFTPAPEPEPDAGVAGDAGVEPDAGVTVAPNAGDIAFAGLMEVALPVSADGTYPNANGTGLLWEADGEVTFSADGADVPAFSEATTGPGTVTLTTPSFITTPLTIDTSSDYALAWTGGTGTVHAAVSSREDTGGGTRAVTVTCTFDAAAGGGAFPADALAMLPAGDRGSFSVDTRIHTPIEPGGGWSITLRTLARGLSDTGATASTSATLTTP